MQTSARENTFMSPGHREQGTRPNMSALFQQTPECHHRAEQLEELPDIEFFCIASSKNMQN